MDEKEVQVHCVMMKCFYHSPVEGFFQSEDIGVPPIKRAIEQHKPAMCYMII